MVTRALRDVRFEGETGSDLLSLNLSAHDPKPTCAALRGRPTMQIRSSSL
jgi:hypothetical protein